MFKILNLSDKFCSEKLLDQRNHEGFASLHHLTPGSIRTRLSYRTEIEYLFKKNLFIMRLHYLTILSVFLHSISSSVLAFYSPSYYTSNACLVGFQAPQRATYTTRSSAPRIGALQETNNPNDKIEGNEQQSGGIPALPPIGESASNESFRSMNLNGSTTLNSEKTSEPIKVPVAFVGSKKFEMQYTCNVCDKRNSIRVSRLGEFESISTN